MSEGLLTIAYIAASVLFILALGGLSNQETARRGNIYGMVGMGIALVATILGSQVTSYGALAVCMVIGAAIGIMVAAQGSSVEAEGLLVTMTVDTTGFFRDDPRQPWELKLTDTVDGSGT